MSDDDKLADLYQDTYDVIVAHHITMEYIYVHILCQTCV